MHRPAGAKSGGHQQETEGRQLRDSRARACAGRWRCRFRRRGGVDRSLGISCLIEAGSAILKASLPENRLHRPLTLLRCVEPMSIVGALAVVEPDVLDQRFASQWMGNVQHLVQWEYPAVRLGSAGDQVGLVDPSRR